MENKDQHDEVGKMIRLFVALLFPEQIKARLGELIDDLKPRSRGIKWVEPKDIHLTLKFIGEVPQKKVGPITEILETVLAGRRQFEGRLVGAGGFPNLRNPRVLWVGLEGAAPAVEIARELDQRLVPAGIKAEKRALSPHLTLGRVKKPGDFSDLAAHIQGLKFDAGAVILDRVALVKSTLTPSGPIYEIVKLYNLE